jgi:hypothetical protein
LYEFEGLGNLKEVQDLLTALDPLVELHLEDQMQLDQLERTRYFTPTTHEW